MKEDQLFWIEYRNEPAGDLEEVGELAYWKIRMQMTMDPTVYLMDRYFESEL